jgi:hypothetical protein
MSSVRPPFTALAVGVTSLLLTTGQAIAADAPGATAAAPQVQVPGLSAAQVLERHIAARGGVPAWKAVQGLQLTGKIDAGRGDNYARAMRVVESSKKATGRGTNAEIAAANGPTQSAAQVQLPFTLDLKRPNKMRLEILVAGTTAVQVYDGQQGWKLRPFLNRADSEPFTKEEARTEAVRDDLDGPLIGSAAKGAKVDLDGTDLVDGQPAYKLKVTQKNGDVKHVWVDARSFLDVKIDGFPRRMDGKMREVFVYQRDFRKVEGVTIPFLLETAVAGYPDTHRVIIEKATVNPKVDDALFAKPRA